MRNVSYKISIKHYNLWMAEPMPVFLVLYDAKQQQAYWLYFQGHFSDPAKQPKKQAKSLQVRIPVANLFTAATVDYAHERKRAILTSLKGKVTHNG